MSPRPGFKVRRVSGSTLDERLEHYAIPEPNSGCFLWLGSVDRKGYGQLRIEGKLSYAHRLSWERINGPIPDNMLMLHKCDVPSCVNPQHLRPGTPKENTADMMRKGRECQAGLALGRRPRT